MTITGFIVDGLFVVVVVGNGFFMLFRWKK